MTDTPAYDSHADASVWNVPETVYSPYRGIDITLRPRRGTRSFYDTEAGRYRYHPTGLWWSATMKGHRGGDVQIARLDSSSGDHQADRDKLLRKARKSVDTILLDREQWPVVQRSIASKVGKQTDGLRLATLADRPDVPLGTVCWVWGMNRWRQGLLVKVAKTRATVAWTSPSSAQGTIYRPSRPFADIYVTDQVVRLP